MGFLAIQIPKRKRNERHSVRAEVRFKMLQFGLNRSPVGDFRLVLRAAIMPQYRYHLVWERSMPFLAETPGTFTIIKFK